MPPSFADYEAAAKAQYEPQLQADITTGKSNTAAQVANLESTKGQINTDYTSAIQNLQNSVQDQTGQINQLYTSRLLGNFSGLQGNDMGKMYSRANQQQGTIESTRANKLSSVATQQTNLQNAEIANESALTSKYQGLEAGAASSGYQSAVKDFQDQQYREQELQLKQQQINSTNASRAATQYNTAYQQQLAAQGGYKVKQGSQGQYMYTDRNGTPISMAEYVANSGGGENTIKNLLQNGTGYDKNIYNKVKGLTGDALQQALSKYSVYGF